MFAFCMMGTLTVSAQLGGLLGKKSAGKKSGSFATVWESEFDNKATRLALCDGDGQYIIGTDDNSASVLDTSGKVIWSGDYKKITTNKTNNSEYQYTIWKDKGGYLFLFDERNPSTCPFIVVWAVTTEFIFSPDSLRKISGI